MQHARGAGVGSVAHHLIYAWSSCIETALPPFVVVGLATRVEKFVATHATAPQRSNDVARQLSQNDDDERGRGASRALQFDFRQRSNWRTYDAHPERVPENLSLSDELRTARDPAFLRSFMLFLDENEMLTPLTQALRRGDDANTAMLLATQLSPNALVDAWRTWVRTESIHIPVLPQSTAPGLNAL